MTKLPDHGNIAAFPFYIIFILPLSVIIGAYLGQFYTYLTPFIVFVMVPILDFVIGESEKNPDPERKEQIEKALKYRIIPWLCGFTQIGLITWYMFYMDQAQLRWYEMMGVIISMGISSGVLGINVAHELVHRVKNRWEPLLGRLMLFTTLYAHWGLEHVVGHHRMVATEEDPATAPKNMSFYRFWGRSVFGAIGSSWKFESDRLDRQKLSPKFLHNRVLRYFIIEVLFLISIALFFDLLTMVFVILQALIAITLLESVNYIEHYGLLRKKDAKGKYESVKPEHSWNSNSILTNHFLFNLQRHSDHHYRAGRRYQLLRYQEDSSQLPTGYAGMILLALIPPLFYKIIHPLIPHKNT